MQEPAADVSHTVICTFGHLMISADKAIPLGLLINELVTNSAKHAYPDGSGEIRVSGERRGAELHVEVSDRESVFRRISIWTSRGRA